jgi:hypothetical protein
LPGVPVLADNEMLFIADLKPPPPKPSGLLAVGGLKLRGVRFHRLPPDFRFEQKALKQRQEPQLLPPVQRLSRFSLVGVFRGLTLLVSLGGAYPGVACKPFSGNLVESFSFGSGWPLLGCQRAVFTYK